MTDERNKKLAREFLEASTVGNIAAMKAMTTDDFTWWVMPSTPFSGEYDKERYFSLMSNVQQGVAGPFTMRFDELTAEDDRVSVTAKGHVELKNGKVYSSDYHYLLFFRDGKIVRGKEYYDSAHLLDTVLSEE